MQPASAPSHVKTLSYIALSVALISVCSWITIPTVVPFTMQTFAVFAVLGLLGGKRGTAAIGCYLLVGLVGLPVFAGFNGGIGSLLGTTGGYLIGFLCMGALYWLMTAVLGRRLWVMALAMVLGLALLYLFGTGWFMLVYLRTTGAVGLWAVLGWCVFPFIVPDLLKLSLALFLIRRLAPHVRL